MNTVFFALSIVAAALLVWKLSPVGFKKLTDVEGNLPTFKSLFGRAGTAALVAVGFIETFGPIFLFAAAVTKSEFAPIFGGVVALVMAGAAVTHLTVWKNSAKQPLTLFAVSLLAIAFWYGAQTVGGTAPSDTTVVADSAAVVDSTVTDTVAVDSIVTDTISR